MHALGMAIYWYICGVFWQSGDDEIEMKPNWIVCTDVKRAQKRL